MEKHWKFFDAGKVDSVSHEIFIRPSTEEYSLYVRVCVLIVLCGTGRVCRNAWPWWCEICEWNAVAWGRRHSIDESISIKYEDDNGAGECRWLAYHYGHKSNNGWRPMPLGKLHAAQFNQSDQHLTRENRRNAIQTSISIVCLFNFRSAFFVCWFSCFASVA